MNFKHSWLAALVFSISAQVLAQTAAAPAAAPVSAAKKELVQRVLALQQPGIENLARQLAEQPAAVLMQQAGPALQNRVPADKREAVARDIQADVKKYVDEAVPLVRDKALKLAPTTVGAVLEDKFSEDELKQLVGILESPVNRKFQQLGGDMQKSLGDKLVADTRSIIEPKVRALEQTMAKRLGLSPEAAARPASAASPPAKK